jgi:arylsulfatase A-like enzyme
MTDAPSSPPRSESLPASLVRALLLAVLGGVVIGCVESLDVLVRDGVRYASWAGLVPLVAAASYALLGGALALPTALAAHLLAGRPVHRAAPPSTCAALGTLVALVAFVLVRSLSLPMLVPAALAGMLLFHALRELLGWWTLLDRPGVWSAFAALGLAANALYVGATTGDTSAAVLVLAACALLAALATRPLASRLGPMPAAVAGLVPGALALGLLANSPPPSARQGEAARGPDVLHISIDTLRADHLGCYGYENARTPTIDRLAAEGVLFEETTAQANTTGPSHTTQLTGLFPAEHGATSNGTPLRHDVRALPELLAERGWETGAFVSGFTLVERACGLAQRFGWYEDNLLAWQWMPQACENLAVIDRVAFRVAARRGTWVTRSDRPAGDAVDAALAWLDGLDGSAPTYTFLHFYDPHAPYEPPHDFAPDGVEVDELNWYSLESARREELVTDEGQRQQMIELYDAEIAYSDAQVARVLERFGSLDDTLVILTSDHGEGLGAHDYFYDHGTFLYDEELHVPLIVRFPRAEHAGRQVAGQTRLLDLTPTVLDFLDIAHDEPMSGSSLLPLLAEPRTSGRPSFAIAEMGGSVSGFEIRGQRLALRSDGFKLIWTSPYWHDTERIEPRLEYYDLGADPDELRDLLREGEEPAAPFRSLKEQLDAWRQATVDLERSGELSEDVAEHLRRLGYL